ncbi:MAG: (2Fe-2S)-binding protein [Chloroflexi bacterium]|nr:(2Fe-2S)-binding protein [Chloroflexota bacterium]
MKTPLTLEVNGRRLTVEVEPPRLLLDVLRDDLGLTGARRGCETGYCGACTVLLDGRAVRSCLQLVVRVKDRHIVTIEGLAKGSELHPVQRAFIEHGAMECGYCIPGMIMLVTGFLAENPTPTEDEIRRVLASNLCRCTGYQKMVEAILSLAPASSSRR